MKVLFVEPPKVFWFAMGEYLPPPYGILQLASFLESKCEDVEIEVLDCNAKRLDWKGLERYIESFNPDIVASSALSTCNTDIAVRTLGTAKKVNPNALTVAGGQHFTAMANESLETYPEIDLVVRGEGEQTFVELVQAFAGNKSFAGINGISFRNNERILHNPSRPLIENLDELPYPGYHFVEDVIQEYHFTGMAGERARRFAFVEGSRGCPHRCTFCSQWRYWEGKWRGKSPKRIADEIESCHENYGIGFLWLTDDNFGLGKNASDLSDELIRRGSSDDIIFFMQARCDEVVKHRDLLPKMRRAGLRWVLLGVESHSPSTLEAFRKETNPDQARDAVRLLKKNDIFTQGMFIIGERKDSAESIEGLRQFANDLDPDLAIFAALTPFPGTEVFQEAKQNGWIEDRNWANYDMAHAIMPTETLSREEVQKELRNCYLDFYGSWSRRIRGLFSRNELKRKNYWRRARTRLKPWKTERYVPEPTS